MDGCCSGVVFQKLASIYFGVGAYSPGIRGTADQICQNKACWFLCKTKGEGSIRVLNQTKSMGVIRLLALFGLLFVAVVAPYSVFAQSVKMPEKASCDLKYYDFSNGGEFKLPQACNGNISVNFDSNSDLKKLEKVDPKIYEALLLLIEGLANKDTSEREELLVKAGVEPNSFSGSGLYVSYPPVTKYWFTIGRYNFKGSVMLKDSRPLLRNAN